MDYDILKAIVEEPAPLALATIVAVKGSVPRHPGSKMLVRGDGFIRGTVGGGRGELAALESAKALVSRGGSTFLTVEMLGEEAVGEAMICGGVNRMLIEVLADRSPYTRAFELIKKGERALLAKRLGGERGGTVSLCLLDEAGKPLSGEASGLDAGAIAKALRSGKASFDETAGVFYDPLFPEEKLLILGGGHVGLALAKAARELGFSVTVADHRPEFAAATRFPEGVATLLGPYAETLGAFPFDGATYVVVVTSGHLFDLDCVRAVLARKYRYAGLIGSARKVKILLEQLRAENFDSAKIDALFSPIGLDIAAETPEEIALSILGEIVAVRRNAPALDELSISRRVKRS